jgi:hypothetical protein
MPQRDEVKYNDDYHRKLMLRCRKWREKNPDYYKKPYLRKGGPGGRPRKKEQLERLKEAEARIHQKIDELTKAAEEDEQK